MNNAREVFQQIKESGIEAIQITADRLRSESSFIEFKGKPYEGPQNSNDETKLSKEIGAFANSDGGLIIYGIDEKDSNIATLQPILGPESLEKQISSSINFLTEPTASVEILTLFTDEHKNSGFVVILVNPALVAPLQSKDKFYYLRAGASSVRANHGQIRRLMLSGNPV